MMSPKTHDSWVCFKTVWQCWSFSHAHSKVACFVAPGGLVKFRAASSRQRTAWDRHFGRQTMGGSGSLFQHILYKNWVQNSFPASNPTEARGYWPLPGRQFPLYCGSSKCFWQALQELPSPTICGSHRAWTLGIVHRRFGDLGLGVVLVDPDFRDDCWHTLLVVSCEAWKCLTTKALLGFGSGRPFFPLLLVIDSVFALCLRMFFCTTLPGKTYLTYCSHVHMVFVMYSHQSVPGRSFLLLQDLAQGLLNLHVSLASRLKKGQPLTTMELVQDSLECHQRFQCRGSLTRIRFGAEKAKFVL